MSHAIFAALAEIEGWVGRSGRERDTIRRSEWAAILLPYDPLAQVMHYLEARGAKIPTSTCALVALRYLARVGCRCREHQRPYLPRMGSAVSDVERVARRHGAWLTAPDELATYPADGDVLCVDRGNPHVLVVKGGRAADGAVLSIEGGQRDNTWTLARVRLLITPPSGALLRDVDDGVSAKVGRERAIYGRVDVARLAETLAMCA